MYTEISSGESFSYFIARAVRELPENGRAAFLLPESLLYVKTHRDIRRKILEEATLLGISYYGPLFKGVYTDVVQLTLQKSRSDMNRRKARIRIDRKPDKPLRENQPIRNYLKNSHYIMNIHCTNRDREVLKKFYKGKIRKPAPCLWLLGTVTGDNARFLTRIAEPGTIPVLTGKEILPFRTLPPRVHLRTDKGPCSSSGTLRSTA